MEKKYQNQEINSFRLAKKIKNITINETNKKKFILTNKRFQIINNVIIIKVLIMINLIQLLSSNIFFSNKFYFSKITLKIKVKGIKKFLAMIQFIIFGVVFIPIKFQ